MRKEGGKISSKVKQKKQKSARLNKIIFTIASHSLLANDKWTVNHYASQSRKWKKEENG